MLIEVDISEWVYPTFIQTKNNGTVRFVSEFTKINRKIHSKTFLITKIEYVILKLEGFVHTSSIYLDEVPGSNPGKVRQIKFFQCIF